MAKYVTDTQVIDALRKAGFTSRVDIITGLAVALAESGSYDYTNKQVRVNVEAKHTNTNGSIDFGAWQINTINADVFTEGNWYDLFANARMAHRVWKRQGWNAWSVVKNGRVANFMDRARRAYDNPNDTRFVLTRYVGYEKPLMRGNDIMQIQKASSNPVVDGIYGLDSEGYVKRFQKDKGLVADGVVGRFTAGALNLIWAGPAT